jgi:FKBP-type peptidyl-prolyl cis-trans isomerase
MKITKLLAVGAVSALILSSCSMNSGTDVSSVEVTTEVDSMSYAIGVSISGGFKQSMVDSVNAEALARGIKDNMSDTDEMIFTEQEANKFLNDYFMAKRMEKIEEDGKENKEASEKFLADNKTREGVKTTDSGLQYEVITEGTGAMPAATDVVKVHYVGTRIDGTQFDSSIQRGEPAQFPLNGVIKGWTEGLQLMKVGAKYKFFIPYDIAYGLTPPQGSGIMPFDALIFEVELLDIVTPEGK